MSKKKNNKKREVINHPTIEEVNYPHLKEGASCFADTACCARERRVEAVSPQA